MIKNRGFSGVLIERNSGRFQDLLRTYRDNPSTVLLNSFIGFAGDSSLDSVLRGTPISRNFELISIDIDGNDYHSWDSLKASRPRVVVIEYNPTVPNAVEYVQAADPAVNRGSGIASMVRLGRSKGYELVATTTCNAIFVDSQDFERFGIRENSPPTLRPDEGAVAYLSHGFDGTITVHGPTTLYWHEFPFAPSSLQVLPKILRKHPGFYSRPERMLFRAYKLWYQRWKGRTAKA